MGISKNKEQNRRKGAAGGAAAGGGRIGGGGVTTRTGRRRCCCRFYIVLRFIIPLGIFIAVVINVSLHYYATQKLLSKEEEGGDYYHPWLLNSHLFRNFTPREEQGNNNNPITINDADKHRFNEKPMVSSSSPPKARTTNHTVAICAMAKEEDRYIDEWVDYHLSIGFSAIYIYDNSEEYTLKWWRETTTVVMGDDGIGGDGADADAAAATTSKRSRRPVYVQHWKGTWMQRKIYHDCISQHRYDHTWIAFFDIDEYLVLKNTTTNNEPSQQQKHNNSNNQHQHEQHVADMLHKHCQTGSLSINWYIFGTSNYTKYEPIPVTRRFVYRERDVDSKTKIIVRTDNFDYTHRNRFGKLDGMESPHHAFLTNGTIQHDTNGKRTRLGHNQHGPTDVAVLHHYKYKSLEEWHYKACIRGRVTGFHNKCDEMVYNGTVFDDTAWQILVRNVPKYGWYDDVLGPLTQQPTMREDVVEGIDILRRDEVGGGGGGGVMMDKVGDDEKKGGVEGTSSSLLRGAGDPNNTNKER